MKKTEHEIWLWIAGYKGRYKISNLGNVKSVARVTIRKNGYPLRVRERILKPWPYGGYLCVDLIDEQVKVHQLVLKTFVGKCPPGKEACHRNDIQTDNRLENLYYGTHKQNAKDAILNERMESKLSISEVRKIRKRLMRKGTLQKDLAKEFNVSIGSISNIKLNKTWRYLK